MELELEHDALDVEAELAKARLLARVLGEPARAMVALGRFDVLRCIGRGGMGKVFEARDRATGAQLALKTLHDAQANALARIKREFRALSTLSHPNLVAMYELHQVRGLPFFTMELVDGVSLSEHLHTEQVVDAAFIRSCLLQLLEGLQAIHASGTVHGDIKPSNLLLRRDGTLILVDFGVARALGEARPGPASGTSKYMAPERMRGGSAAAPSDWYAVGAVLASLLERASASERQLFSGLCSGLLHGDACARAGAAEIRRALGMSGATPHGLGERELFVGREGELAVLRAAFEASKLGPSVCIVMGDPGIGKTALVEHFLSRCAGAVVLRGRCFEHEALPYKGFDSVIEGLAAELRRSPIEVHDTAELCQVFPALAEVLASPPLAAAATKDARAVRRKAFTALAALLKALSQAHRVALFLDDLQWSDADGAALLEHLLNAPAPPSLLMIATQRSRESGAGIAALTRLSETCSHVTLRLEPLSALASAALARGLAPPELEREAALHFARESGGSPLLLRALLRRGADASSQERSYEALVIGMLAQLGAAARALLELVVLAGRPVRVELLRVAANASEHPWKLIAALHNAGLVRSLRRAGQLALSPHHDRVAETIAGLLADGERRARHLALAAAAEALALDDPEFSADQYFRAAELPAAARHFERAGDRARDAVALQRACEHYARALDCHAPARPLTCVRKLAEACAALGDLARAASLYLEAAASAETALQLQLKAAKTDLSPSPRANASQAAREASSQAPLDSATQALRAANSPFTQDEAGRDSRAAPVQVSRDEAVQVLGDEAGRVSVDDVGQLQLKAAEMYLLSGADALGMRLLRPALRRAGIWLPTSDLGALALGVVSLARFHWAFRVQPPAADTADAQAEIAFRIGYCIALMHPRHGAALLLWSGARAMRLGSRAQRGCALVHTTYVHALLGLGSRRAQDQRIAQALALTCDDRIAHAFVLCGDAIISFARAECAATLEKCASAQAYIEAKQVEERWLLTQLQTIVASTRVMSGDFVGLDAYAAQLEREASELGNRAVIVQAQSARAWAGLAAGDTSRMQAYASAARETWHAARLSTLYGLAIWAEGHRLLYAGEPQAALALLRAEAPRFARSSLARTEPWSTAMTLLWADIELSCSESPRDAHCRAAEVLVKRLERRAKVPHLRDWRSWRIAQVDAKSRWAALLRGALAHRQADSASASVCHEQARAGFEACGQLDEKSRWAAACAALLRGAIARRRADSASASVCYEQARIGFEACGMHGLAAVAAYRGAELVSDSARPEDAVPWFRAQGVAEPAKWVRMYAP